MAVKMIEGNDEVRARKFMQAYKKLCQQYDCMIVPDLKIVAMPREPIAKEGAIDPKLQEAASSEGNYKQKDNVS